MTNHQATVPPAVYRYFTQTGTPPMCQLPDGSPVAVIEHPIVAEVFYPGRGWVRAEFTKRVSSSWLRKLRRDGAAAVALRCGSRLADFTIASALTAR